MKTHIIAKGVVDENPYYCNAKGVIDKNPYPAKK